MDRYGIIVEEMTPKFRFQRLNYSFLMKYFLEAGYEGENISELNRCIMHIHDTFLYEIVTGGGKNLVSNSLAGRTGESRDLYSWPTQPSPNKKIRDK